MKNTLALCTLCVFLVFGISTHLMAKNGWETINRCEKCKDKNKG